MTTEPAPLNQISTIGVLVPVTTIIEIVLNLLAAIPCALLLQSAMGGSAIMLAVALFLSLYLYSAVFIALGALVTRLTPKPKLGRLTTTSDKLRYGIIGAMANLLQRHPLAGLLLRTSPMPGNLIYTLAGAKIHPSCLIAEHAILCDPFLTEIGAGTIVGQQAILSGHLIPEPSTTFLGKVIIGKNVLIGANSVVYPAVKIGDGAQLQAFSRVDPGTRIPAGEVWGGIPAAKIKDATANSQTTQRE